MDSERFTGLVARAVDNLPEEFRSRMENIDVVVEEQPTPRQLSEVKLKRGITLLGLYQGVPLPWRGRSYGLVVPDKITIFQKPIEDMCKHDADIELEIRRVIRHEIAHHFGIGDARLRQLEKGEG